MAQVHYSVLEETINYSFKNKELLVEALTHSSYANELRAKKQNVQCNERLEFLGDSVLSVIVSEYLFKKYADVPEGQLTQFRASLVQSQALALYARSINLGDYLFLGHGEEKSNGRERQSTLENAFEALLASIYLDSNGSKETVAKFLLPLVTDEIEEASKNEINRDYKTALQQFVQANGKEKISYVSVDEYGPDHAKVFVMEVRINSNVVGKGTGSSKREAEQFAAKEACELFDIK